MATNLFFNGSSDPLLSSGVPQQVDYEQRIAELQQMQQSLEVQRRQMRGQQQSNSPVWDEIERLTADFSDREFSIVNNDQEFQESQNGILAILQREQMRMMRPIVEGTKDGKEALENHLELIKRLKKKAANEANRDMELFSEYTRNYPDMTFSEFLKMKNGGGSKATNSKKK